MRLFAAATGLLSMQIPPVAVRVCTFVITAVLFVRRRLLLAARLFAWVVSAVLLMRRRWFAIQQASAAATGLLMRQAPLLAHVSTMRACEDCPGEER